MAFSGLVFVIVGETSVSRDELEKQIKGADGTVAKAVRKNVSAPAYFIVDHLIYRIYLMQVTHLLCGKGAEDTAAYEKLAKNTDVYLVSEKFISKLESLYCRDHRVTMTF